MRAFLLLLALAACSGSSGDSKPGEQTGPTGETAGTSETASETGSGIIEGPAQAHVEPDAGTMCFACHLCGNEGAETLETTHWVCVDCHRGPDGSVPEEVQSDCGCGALDCSTDPPTLPCADCHVVDGTNGNSSTQHMNSLCSACHVAGEGALRPGSLSPHG